MVKDTRCAVSLDVFQPQTSFQFSKKESIEAKTVQKRGVSKYLY